jgi:hypothetical protein
MGQVSTAIVVAVVVGLMLLGIGMVVNQLVRLRRYLGETPAEKLLPEDPHDPPGPTSS